MENALPLGIAENDQTLNDRTGTKKSQLDPVTDPLVSAVLGNFNGRRFLKDCFDSLENQSYPNLETIFVDDESTDGSSEFVSRNFPNVKVIQNTRSEKGFAACCDAGAHIARAEYLLFLNVDIELDPNCVRHLVKRMEEDLSIGVCGPKLLSLSDRRRIVSAGGTLDIFGFGMDRGLDELDDGRFSRSEQVSFITGAVALVRRDALTAAGGWDIDTFTYAEDSDLCWRILLKGYKVVYEPASIAFHFHSPSMGRASPRKIFFMDRNRLTSMIKNYSLPTLIGVMPGWFIVAAARIVYFSARRRTDIVRASARAYVQVLRMLPFTLRKRTLVQTTRNVPDKEILRHFAKESLEARLLLSQKFRLPSDS
jgi:GT2 family glycosyltransferase